MTRHETILFVDWSTAVIVAVPGAMPFTLPSSVTVAMESLDDDHVTLPTLPVVVSVKVRVFATV